MNAIKLWLFKLRIKWRSREVSKQLSNPNLTLVGDCSMCGLCCLVTAPEGGLLKCANLIVRDWNQLGKPGATRCGYHESRYDGMHIYLIDKQGKLRGESRCHTGRAEMEAIIERRLIEKGCSLKIVEDTDGKLC